MKRWLVESEIKESVVFQKSDKVPCDSLLNRSSEKKTGYLMITPFTCEMFDESDKDCNERDKPL